MSGIEMVNQPKHYNDESGVPCCDVTDFMMFNSVHCFVYGKCVIITNESRCATTGSLYAILALVRR